MSRSMIGSLSTISHSLGSTVSKMPTYQASHPLTHLQCSVTIHTPMYSWSLWCCCSGPCSTNLEIERRKYWTEMKLYDDRIAELRREIELIQRQKNFVPWPTLNNINRDENRITFIQKCPIESCNGFLNNSWKFPKSRIGCKVCKCALFLPGGVSLILNPKLLSPMSSDEPRACYHFALGRQRTTFQR